MFPKETMIKEITIMLENKKDVISNPLLKYDIEYNAPQMKPMNRTLIAFGHHLISLLAGRSLQILSKSLSLYFWESSLSGFLYCLLLLLVDFADSNISR